MLNQSDSLNRAGAAFNEGNWPSRPSSLLQNHGWLNQQVVCGCPACMTLSDRRLEALAANGTIAPLNTFDSGAPLALDQTFKLHSNPTASHTIYLDFNGHITENTSWNSYFNNPSIVSPAYDIDGNAASFSSTELERIQRIWMRVAEDFAPFNVNVTTEAPVLGDLIKTDSSDSRWGVRVVVTKDTESSGAGGIAYINSFNWNSDTPVWVFNSSEIGVSAAASHEVGHALGLSHDGTSATTYYNGHGSGETGWGPIMGSGYYQNVTTWDDGTYYNSNNGGSGANYNKGPDDLAVITGGNGFSYRIDDHGNSFNTASALNLGAANGSLVEVSQFGVIERRTDVDYFSFTTGEGLVNLSFNSYFSQIFVSDGNGGYETRYLPAPFDGAGSSNDQGSNLDIRASLFDGNQTLIASSNPLGLSAGFTNLFLTAGDYFIEIDGVGFGNPTSSSPTGYSDYGSLGQYYVTGTIPGVPVVNAGIIVTPTAGLTTSEDGDSASFTVVLASAPTVEVVINLSSSNIQEGVADQSQLVFTAENWNVAQTVTVTGVNDEVIDGDQPYSVLLAPAVSTDGNYNGLDAEDVQLVNLDNDVPAVTVAFSTGNQTLVEGLATSAVYTVSLSAASSQTITVDYATSNGSALAGSDYVALAGTLTFAPGATEQTLTVSLLNDALNEADETFTLDLLNPVNASFGANASVVTTLTDTLLADVSAVLPNGVENLTLTGADNINGAGNSAANIITGNSGANLLRGGGGLDTLLGGAGNDLFDLTGITSAANRNLIGDFASGDQIRLSDSLTTPAKTGTPTVALINQATSVTLNTSQNDLFIFNFNNTEAGVNLDAATNGSALLDGLSAASGKSDVAKLYANTANGKGYILAYDNDNAYLYRFGASGVKNAVAANSISLIGIIDSPEALAVGSFGAADFSLV